MRAAAPKDANASEAANALKRLEVKDDETDMTKISQSGNDENKKIDVDNEDADSLDNSSSTVSTLPDDLKDEDDDSPQNQVPSTEEAESRLLQATGLKDTGNSHFKENELEKAARCYRQAVTKLKPLMRHAVTADEQVKGCFVALQTNLSMVLYKQKKYKLSVDIATRGLQHVNNMEKQQPSNGNREPISCSDASKVKLLYRRAVASRSLGNLEKSRDDLRQALQIDTQNVSCKRELAVIKKELEQSKENQKKALAKAFSSNKSGSFLYKDKEEEKKQREEIERLKKEEEAHLKKKRKAQWEDECVKRMANNEPAISFEEWEKEQEEEKKRKEKEEEKKRKEERRKRREQARKNKQETVEDNSSDDELTEQELAKMRGYKKTKDGRTTSYFTREISEEEKKVLAVAPKRLDPPDTVRQPLSQNNSFDAGAISRPSAWNAAGTWEEKDTTLWCTSQLRKRLEETHVTMDHFDADIISVEDINGHASVAMTAGKKRYIFEYDVKLKYEIKNFNKSDKIIAKGTVRLPDICSTSHEEVEVAFEAWEEKPNSKHADMATSLQKILASEVRAQIQIWLRDFNEQY